MGILCVNNKPKWDITAQRIDGGYYFFWILSNLEGTRHKIILDVNNDERDVVESGCG